MSGRRQNSSINWTEAEAAAYSGRRYEAPHSEDLAVFFARSMNHQYLKAEGICLAGQDMDPLQLVRTLIARGQTEEALSLVRQSLQSHLPHEQAVEYQLELARLHALHGKWMEAATVATELLSCDLPPVTRMTTLQCRSIAHYELGAWAQAIRDIHLIRAMATLYPLAPAGFYAEILKAKIDMAKGLYSSATRELQRLWTILREPSAFSIDRLQTLLRAEADFERFQGKCSRRWTLATHDLATSIGDDLYAALARLELFAGGDRSEELVHLLGVDEGRHPRVRYLKSNLLGDVHTSTTLRLLAKASSQMSTASSSGPSFQSRSTNLRAIVIPSKSMLVRLPRNTGLGLSENPDTSPIVVEPKAKQLFKAAQIILSKEGCSKAELFRGLFGASKYAPHLHDSTLYQVISRLRRRLGMEVIVDDGVIRIEGVLLIEESECAG